MKKLLFTISLFILSGTVAAQDLDLNRNTFELVLGAGRRAYINSKKAMLRSTFSMNYNIRLHPLWDLKLGADAVYFDHVFDGNNLGKGYILRSTSYGHFAYGAFLGADFKMNRVIAQFGMAKYIYFNDLPQYNMQFYSKLGMRYVISRHVSVGFLMRAHQAEADYMDFNLSYKF